MKAALPTSYRNVIVPKTPVPTGAYTGNVAVEEWRVDFYIPDQPPDAKYPPVYNVSGNDARSGLCTASGDPLYPDGCPDGDAAALAMYEKSKLTYPQCIHLPLGFQGAFASPFSSVSSEGYRSRWGRVQFTPKDYYTTRQWVYTLQCPGWNPPDPVTNKNYIAKSQSFLCADKFTPVAGYSSLAQSPSGAGEIVSGATCRPTEAMPQILFKERLTASCPAGNNPGPCHPATGDKSRNEVDFEFAGVAFTRYYHSLRQTGQLPAFAPGWTHSFSDRVLDGGVDNMRIIRGDGNVEYFLPLANNEYKSSQSTRKKLVKLADGSYRIYDEAGTVLIFNSAGRLIRQERSITGLQTIDFTYEGDKLVRAQDQTGRALIFVYTDGRLSRITLPDGQSVDFRFDANANFEQVTYADGSSKRYHYNEAGLSLANDAHALTGITTENQRRYSSYGYNTNGRVTLSQRHKGDGTYVEKTTVDYSNPLRPVAILPYGEVVTYDLVPERAYTRIAGMSSSRGTYLASYPGNGSGATQVGLVGGRTTRFVYTESYESERVEAYGTPDERKVVTVRDPAYRITSREVQAKSGSSYVSKQRLSYTYNNRGQLLTATVSDPVTAAARTTTMSYCEQADVNAGVCPLVGLLKSVDGPRSDVVDVTTLAYRADDDPNCAIGPASCQYRKGDLWTITNARGHVTEFVKSDGAGRPLTIRDVNGVLTDFEYDLRGRLIARKQRGTNDGSESDDRILRIDYWPTGLVKQITQPDSTYLIYDHDDAHRLTSIRDNAGNRVDLTLSPASQTLKHEIKDPSGALKLSLSRTYTTLDQLQSQIDAYGRATTFSYDGNENPDLATDALTRVSDSDHDALNRLKRTLHDVNGVAAETTYGYDALDNLIRVTDPKGLDTIYTYNGLGDQTQLQSPDTGITTYTYDDAGNLASRVDANGKSISYRYDALNRLRMIDYAANVPDETFAYDVAMSDCQAGENFNIGRLGRMSDESGSTSFCYNRFGDLVRKVQRTSNRALSLRWQYAADGRLQSMTYPDNSVVDYAYDAQGRISEIGVTRLRLGREVLISNVLYNPFGPVAQWTYGNGRTLSRSYNLNYQPYSIQDNAIGGLNLGYEFDAVGNLKRLRAADHSDPPTRIYDYDGLNRLTEAKDAANVIWQNYSYDKTGNRLSSGVTTATTTQSCPQGQGGPCTTGTALVWSSFAYAYASDSHRLLSAGDGAQRSYDLAGNLTTMTPVAPTTPRAMAQRSFVYNEANRLAQVSSTGLLQANYRYNSYGQRVYRQTPSATTYSVYDQAGHWLGDYESNGAAIQQVIWLGDMPVGVSARMPGGATQLHYIEADMLGSPRVVIDPQRNVAVWRWELAGEAFGDGEPNQDPDGDGYWFVFDMRYPGQRYDAPSGLNYNYFRDYETFTGRYVESDPIGMSGGISTYGYVGGHPFIWKDPAGLERIGIHTDAVPGGAHQMHAWLGIYDDNGALLTTLGGWPSSHKYTKDAARGCECSDVYSNIEKTHRYEPRTSFFIYATKEQIAELLLFANEPWSWSLYSNNCSSWVEQAIERLYPEFDLITSSANVLFGDSPANLATNLQFYRNQLPQNSVTNPYRPPPRK